MSVGYTLVGATSVSYAMVVMLAYETGVATRDDSCCKTWLVYAEAKALIMVSRRVSVLRVSLLACACRYCCNDSALRVSLLACASYADTGACGGGIRV